MKKKSHHVLSKFEKPSAAAEIFLNQLRKWLLYGNKVINALDFCDETCTDRGKRDIQLPV